MELEGSYKTVERAVYDFADTINTMYDDMRRLRMEYEEMLKKKDEEIEKLKTDRLKSFMVKSIAQRKRKPK